MEMIGRYEIRRELGRGGMATVYLAHDPAVGRDVAIKVMAAQLADDPVLYERFRIEAHTVAALEHEAIVPLYDFGESGGRPYLVMRLMHRGSLAERLADKPLPYPATMRVVRRVAGALDAAHEAGIVHRDLKAGNILFDARGDAYLSDFGIVKELDAQRGLTGEYIVGTPAYMSPEQIRGAAVDARSDIYSLGVVLYEMLTGRQPYEGTTPMGIAAKHLTEPIPDPRAANPELPDAVAAVIRRALAKEPARRYATAGGLATALEAALQEAGLLTGTGPRLAAVAEGDAAWRAVEKRGRRGASEAAPPVIAPIEPRAAERATKERPWWQRRPAWLWGILSVLMLAVVGVGLLLAGLAGPGSAGGATAVAGAGAGGESQTPTLQPTAPPPFSADRYGTLLLVQGPDSSAQQLGALLEGDLRAALVESGVREGVESLVLPLAPGEEVSLEARAVAQQARLALLISLVTEGGGYSVSARSHFRGDFEPGIYREAASLEATAEALLASFSAPTLGGASSELARRTSAVVNSALGYEALRDGEHAECTRRFTAELALLERIDVTANRADVSQTALGTCLAAQGREEEARRQFEQAIEHNPNYALAYYGLGNVYYGQVDYERAQAYYEQTIEKAAVDPLASERVVGRAYVGLGNIAVANGAYEAALPSFDKAIAAERDFPAYYLARAIAYRALGREAEASSDLEQCVVLAEMQSPQSDYYQQLEGECRELLNLPLAPTATATPRPATAVPPAEVRVIFSSVSLRAGPGVNYRVVGYLLEGTIVTVVAQTTDGSWYNVLLNDGGRAWVYAEVVELLEGGARQEEIPVAVTTPAPLYTPTGTSTATRPPTVAPLPTATSELTVTATEPPTAPPTQPPTVPAVTATATQPPTVPPEGTPTQPATIPPTVPAATATPPPTVPPGTATAAP